MIERILGFVEIFVMEITYHKVRKVALMISYINTAVKFSTIVLSRFKT